MKKNLVTIGFGLVLFLSGAFGGLPVAAEASSIAYPNQNWQYPQQYDYWYANYSQNYTTNAGWSYNNAQYAYQPQCDYVDAYGTCYSYGYNNANTYNQYNYNGYSYGYDYNYQQQLADWQYQKQLADYYAQLQSTQYYNNVVYQGGYPYYVPACSYDDHVHNTCTQFQFTAELMGANNDIACTFYGQCWSYGNGWPYRY